MAPDVTYRDELTVEAAGTAIRLIHARGETDDHTWAWLPEQRVACVGDLFIWNFPNAGNPQKVQRYPEDWAAALRSIIEREPELLLPAHGLPIAGRERIARVLDVAATALEALVRDVLAMMNGGASLDEIIHTVRVDDAVLQLPYMRPLYDEPEFVIRNVWRRYGGWWDADPANLKPAPRAALASRAGDAGRRGGPARRTGRRARRRRRPPPGLPPRRAGGRRRAGRPAVHATRADIYERRRQHRDVPDDEGHLRRHGPGEPQPQSG